MELYPVANADQIKRLIGGAFGTEVKTKKKKTDYAATHIEKLLYDEGLDVDIQDRSHFV